MEIALHDPEHGYYALGPDRLGRGGDFYTASDAGTLLGECLATQLVEMDRILGKPSVFRYVEAGAGRGLLARDLLDALRVADPGLHGRVEAVLVERSAGMREACRETVPEARIVPNAPRADGASGCAVAVELFDALPVHRLRRREGRLIEVFVSLDSEGDLVEREGEPGPEARALAERYGAAVREGEEAEVAPSLGPAFDALAGSIERGFVLIVDYGDDAPSLYSPSRARGTLLAYHRHTVHEEPLRLVGEQDLTAHVNFTALVDRAQSLGLVPLGTTTQDRFLIANGILRVFEEGEGADWASPARVKRRLRAKQLLHPVGMGRTFRVFVAAKGLGEPPSLRGLLDPFAR